MPRAAVFSTNFLEYSQTFVHEEVTHHQRYQVGGVLPQAHVPERFPFEPVHVGGPLYGVTRQSPTFRPAVRGRALRRWSTATSAPARSTPCRTRVRHRLPLVVTFHGYDVPLLRSAARF